MSENEKMRIAREIAKSCLVVRARLLNRLISRFFDDQLRPLAITSPQLNLLVAISLNEGASASEIGRRLEMEKSTVSRNLGRMIDHGWINREVGLSTTRKGTVLLNKVLPIWRKAQKDMNKMLGSEASEAIVTACKPFLS